jgi:hypothetical protein
MFIATEPEPVKSSRDIVANDGKGIEECVGRVGV